MSAYFFRLAGYKDMVDMVGLISDCRQRLGEKGLSVDDLPDMSRLLDFLDKGRAYITITAGLEPPHAISFALVSIQETTPYLTFLCSNVKGAGAALLDFIETGLQEEGYETLYITASKGLIPYFVNLGYTRDGVFLYKYLGSSAEREVSV